MTRTNPKPLSSKELRLVGELLKLAAEVFAKNNDNRINLNEFRRRTGEFTVDEARALVTEAIDTDGRGARAPSEESSPSATAVFEHLPDWWLMEHLAKKAYASADAMEK